MKKLLALSLMIIICLSTLSSCEFIDKIKDMYNDFYEHGTESLTLVQDFTVELLSKDYDNALTKIHPSSTINKENLEKMRADLLKNHNLDELDSSSTISFTKLDFNISPIVSENGDIIQTQYTVILTLEIAGIPVSIFSIVLQDDLGFGIYTYVIR